MSDLAKGSDETYCSGYPAEGHAMISHSVDAAPVRWIERCQFCGFISSRAIREQLEKGAPSEGFREVPAECASLKLKHVEDCMCRYVPVAGGEVKLIDARCVAAYVVPDRSVLVHVTARPQGWPSAISVEDLRDWTRTRD